MKWFGILLKRKSGHPEVHYPKPSKLPDTSCTTVNKTADKQSSDPDISTKDRRGPQEACRRGDEGPAEQLQDRNSEKTQGSASSSSSKLKNGDPKLAAANGRPKSNEGGSCMGCYCLSWNASRNCKASQRKGNENSYAARPLQTERQAKKKETKEALAKLEERRRQKIAQTHLCRKAPEKEHLNLDPVATPVLSPVQLGAGPYKSLLPAQYSSGEDPSEAVATLVETHEQLRQKAFDRIRENARPESPYDEPPGNANLAARQCAANSATQVSAPEPQRGRDPTPPRRRPTPDNDLRGRGRDAGSPDYSRNQVPATPFDDSAPMCLGSGRPSRPTVWPTANRRGKHDGGSDRLLVGGAQKTLRQTGAFGGGDPSFKLQSPSSGLRNSVSISGTMGPVLPYGVDPQPQQRQPAVVGLPISAILPPLRRGMPDARGAGRSDHEAGEYSRHDTTAAAEAQIPVSRMLSFDLTWEKSEGQTSPKKDAMDLTDDVVDIAPAPAMAPFNVTREPPPSFFFGPLTSTDSHEDNLGPQSMDIWRKRPEDPSDVLLETRSQPMDVDMHMDNDDQEDYMDIEHSDGLEGAESSFTHFEGSTSTGNHRPHLVSYHRQPSEEADSYVVDSKRGSFSDPDIDPSEISLCYDNDGMPSKLGEGAFGSVYRAMRGGVTEVAVKVLQEAKSVDVTAFQREAAVLASCRDPNICQFLGACFQPGCLMIVMEFCSGGDLRAKLSSLMEGESYQYKKKGRQLMLDVAAGLAYLHSKRVIHFDLKASNIMLVGGDRAKIGDVGLASVLSNCNYVSKLQHNGTFAYAAPELLMGWKCGPAADMYSFGVLLHEVCTGEYPKRGRLRNLRVPEEVSSTAIESLMIACLDVDPHKRPTARQAHSVLKASA